MISIYNLNSQSPKHDYQDLITIFDACFALQYNTRLLKGGDEPIYIPANAEQNYHALFFAHGFFSSALHECSHWFIAGEERRKQVDFGYWYEPDGRTVEQQVLFQQMEVKPQAIEWILSMACDYPFQVSADNLQGSSLDTLAFQQAIHLQVLHYCQHGLPPRANQFRIALCSFYNQSVDLQKVLGI